MAKRTPIPPTLYALLDVTAGQPVFVLKAGMREVQLQARIRSHLEGKTFKAPPIDERLPDRFDENALASLFSSLGGAPDTAPALRKGAVLSFLRAREGDSATLASLEREAARIGAPEACLIKGMMPPPKPVAEKAKDTSFQMPTRPKPGTTTGFIWDCCDQLLAKLQRTPTPKEVQAVCVGDEGQNPSTVSIQFHKWRRALEQVQKTC